MIARIANSSAIAFVAPLVTGLFLALTFPPFDCVWLSWIALIPLAYVLRVKARPLSIYAGLFVGMLIFFLLGLDWMRTCYGGQGLVTRGTLRLVLLSEMGALCGTLLFAFFRFLERRTRWSMAIALPIVVVSMQYVTWLAGMVTSGSPFPWLQIGLPAIHYLRLAQIADLGGVWLVSYLIAAVNGALFDLATALCEAWRLRSLRFRKPGAAVFAGILPLACAMMYGEVRIRTTEARPGPRVALMPLRECPKIDLANTDEPPRMALPSEPVDVLLWSERAFGHTILDVRSQSDEFWNVCLDDQITDGSEKRVLEKAASVADAVLFVGADRLVERADGTYAYCNCLACFNPRSGYAGASDKKYLVPFTERVPLSNGFDMRRGQFVPGEEYPLFECSRRETGERFRCAAAICYDAAFPAVFYLSRYEEPPQFFLVASAESFERTGRLQACVLQAARFRAIENRRAIVRNVQGGRSGLIDSAGRYQSTELPWEITRPVALSHVPIDDRFSLYAVVGDWVPLVCLLVVLFRVTRMLLGRGLADCTL